MTTPLGDEIDRLTKENSYLRGLVQHNPNWKCSYGHQIDTMAKCPSGFPGCACADDIMCADDEVAKMVSEENKRLREEVRVLREALYVIATHTNRTNILLQAQ